MCFQCDNIGRYTKMTLVHCLPRKYFLVRYRKMTWEQLLNQGYFSSIPVRVVENSVSLGEGNNRERYLRKLILMGDPTSRQAFSNISRVTHPPSVHSLMRVGKKTSPFFDKLSSSLFQCYTELGRIEFVYLILLIKIQIITQESLPETVRSTLDVTILQPSLASQTYLPESVILTSVITKRPLPSSIALLGNSPPALFHFTLIVCKQKNKLFCPDYS